MSPTKLLLGQIVLVLLTAVLGVWAATEWAAYQLGWQEGLGPAWFCIFDLPAYRPWQLFIWWYFYDAYAPHVFYRAGALAASSGLMGCGVAVAGSLWRARQARRVTTYGSAHWASPSDLRRLDLQANQGVFLGRLGATYLRHAGPEHVLAFAPTRSGKGVGLVIPTLLSWLGSVIVHDIKGENWEVTAGWRAQFSHCLLFNPTDPRSARFNPLLEVRKGKDEVRDVQNIADVLVDPEGSIERRSHWENTSHSLLVGAILHVLYADEDKSLARVAALLSDPHRTFAYTLHRMLGTNHIGTAAAPQVHPVVAAVARELLNKSENERSGVLSTAMSFLSLYRDPIVSAVTASSDWRIADLMDGARPASLYLVVPPSDISRTKPLVRLILNQIGRRLTERLGGREHSGHQHRLLLMLDEFPALGRLDFFETSLAFMAGYGIRAVLIAQSLNQIVQAYGDNNSILDNCHIRIAFSTNDERTAKRISEALGTATELRAQRNYAGHRLSPWLGHVMVSRQETARPLLTPGEIMQLPPEEELVLVSGAPPIRAKKIRYFEDRNFTARRLTPPGLSTQTYADRPKPRPNDWGRQVCGVSRVLMAALTDSDASGGPGRKPELETEDPTPKPAPVERDDRVSDDDEADPVADRATLERIAQQRNLVAADAFGFDADRNDKALIHDHLRDD
ncbi:MAG TPA: conjugal transfer protein TraG [Asticcacaulis sp.]|nr:conjugal transfer protein TraG [Asticcacaulis sp.]